MAYVVCQAVVKKQWSEKTVSPPDCSLDIYFETCLHRFHCSECLQKNYRGTQANVVNKYALQSVHYCLLIKTVDKSWF